MTVVKKKPRKQISRKEINEDYRDHIDLSYVGLTQDDLNKAQQEKKIVGRPPYIPCKRDYDVIRALCLFGADHDWISSYVGITAKTLRKYYPELLAECKEDKNGSAEAALFVQVMRGNVEAIKAWLTFNMPDKYGKNAGQSPDGANSSEFLEAVAKVLNHAHK